MEESTIRALETALDANAAYMQYIQTIRQQLIHTENRIHQSLRDTEHRIALRRASIAVKAFDSAPAARAINRKNTFRTHVSFFHDLPSSKRRYRSKPDIEPEANKDTLFLRRFFHKGFYPSLPPTFSYKEQECIKDFVRLILHNDPSRVHAREEWESIVSMYPKLLGKRSAFACQLRYSLHDAPDLRFGAWTKEEDQMLQILASGVKDPTIIRRWDEIAKRMPHSGRPPVHCLIRYQTKLCTSNLKSQFTEKEDEMIVRGVEAFGEHWNMIADLMDGRVGEQIRFRWQQSLSPNVRRGKFSIIEDRRLLLALYAYHNASLPLLKDAIHWHEISHHVPGRLPQQLRERFLNSLNPEIRFGSWTEKEDRELLEMVEKHCENQNSPGFWSFIASQLGERTDNQVMRRWKALAPLNHTQRQVANEKSKTLPLVFQRAVLRKRTGHVYQRRCSYIATEESGQAKDRDAA